MSGIPIPLKEKILLVFGSIGGLLVIIAILLLNLFPFYIQHKAKMRAAAREQVPVIVYPEAHTQPQDIGWDILLSDAFRINEFYPLPDTPFVYFHFIEETMAIDQMLQRKGLTREPYMEVTLILDWHTGKKVFHIVLPEEEERSTNGLRREIDFSAKYAFVQDEKPSLLITRRQTYVLDENFNSQSLDSMNLMKYERRFNVYAVINEDGVCEIDIDQLSFLNYHPIPFTGYFSRYYPPSEYKLIDGNLQKEVAWEDMQKRYGNKHQIQFLQKDLYFGTIRGNASFANRLTCYPLINDSRSFKRVVDVFFLLYS